MKVSYTACRTLCNRLGEGGGGEVVLLSSRRVLVPGNEANVYSGTSNRDPSKEDKPRNKGQLYLCILHTPYKIHNFTSLATKDKKIRSFTTITST